MKNYNIIETNAYEHKKSYVIDVKKQFLRWTWWTRLQHYRHALGGGKDVDFVFLSIEEAEDHLEEINESSKIKEKVVKEIIYK